VLYKIKMFLKEKFGLRPFLALSLIFVIILAGAFLSGAKYYYKPKAQVAETKVEEGTAEGEPQVAPVAEEEIKKNPPKLSSKGSTKKVPTSQGEATAVSTGGAISGSDADKLAGYADDGPATTISYNDTTGRYPSLGTTLINYLYSNLLSSSSERAYMYQIEIIDCSSCNYGGLYTGSYLQNGNDIYKAYGWIKLNSYYYKDSPYFEDYMKLILSHEYGHHYSLYHRWVDLDIPYGDRWPATYYSTRPLSLATTAPDYSKGWGNCDVEIMAEDYSYFYSGYGQHAMSGTYGYPSSAVRTWLASLSQSTAEDTIAPTVSITSPANGATVSGSVSITANASDNVGVTRVDFLIDGAVVSNDSASPYQYSWSSGSVANGAHAIATRAYDSEQYAESSITVTVSNSVSDTEAPNVVINQPAANPYNWTGGDLTVEATGTDNVGVVKTEFYINGSLAAEESSNHIIRLWRYATTPVGSYTLSAKAYDAAGNTKETSITVNRS
jgi:hypothetical protein